MTDPVQLTIDGDEVELDDIELPSEAHARTSDPWTSHAAAASLDEDRLSATQEAVLDCFRRYGPMHHELLIHRYLPGGSPAWPTQSQSGLRTRTRELVAGGLLCDTGETVVLASGRKSIVWGEPE